MFFNRHRYKDQKATIVFVEDEDDITDEIEKSLWMIKESLDLPTEEVDIAIRSRKKSKQSRGNK